MRTGASGRLAILGISLIALIGAAGRHASVNEATRGRTVQTFCPADGYIRSDGVLLARDNSQHCAWVDPGGHRVPVDADGTPIDE